ncbi:hypothetical protein [Actinoplanes sp. NPDC051851]|uniref:hypothetical protein n=1 Tax=Actinoplanes sp. NPDC051851 TaxID=3154753 RepID=UPI003446F020
MSRDAFADVAALIHPLPEPPDDDHDVDGYESAREQILAERTRTAEQLRLAADSDPSTDPVLGALSTARRQREAAERLTSRVFAYAREFDRRNRYTLDELAAAAGYRSPSGVATAYTHHDVADVTDQTGTRPSPRAEPPDPDPKEVEALLHDMQRRGPATARDRVMEVYYLLIKQGWSPYPPQPRDPGTKAAKRYIRWTRHWPGGTSVTLYQEPAGYLGASSKISDDDPRRFYADYTEPGHDITYVTQQLAELVKRVDRHDAVRV